MLPGLFNSLAERIEPDNVLDRAAAAAQAERKRALTFKLWPDALEPETVERMVLSRPGLRVIFVVRRQIDADELAVCGAEHRRPRQAGPNQGRRRQARQLAGLLPGARIARPR